MNLNKRFFLITALTMAFFAAMALAPLHKQSVPTVLAKSSPATVVLMCSPSGFNHNGQGLTGYGVTYVDTSDPGVTLPTIGQPDPNDGNLYDPGTLCGAALQGLYNQGFSPQPGVQSGYAGGNGGMIQLVYTLAR